MKYKPIKTSLIKLVTIFSSNGAQDENIKKKGLSTFFGQEVSEVFVFNVEIKGEASMNFYPIL